MALARVQATPKATASALPAASCVFATPPALGGGVIVLVTCWRVSGSTTLPTTCADTYGNSYTLARVAALDTSVAAVFVCAAVGSTGASFTVTAQCAPLNAYWVLQAVEVSGVGTGLTVDQSSGASGTSASPATGTTAALTGTEAVQAAVHAISAAQSAITVVSATPTWTQEFEELPFSFIAGEADTRIVPSAVGTTPSCSWTDTASAIWAAVLVAFTAGGAAAARSETYVWGPL